MKRSTIMLLTLVGIALAGMLLLAPSSNPTRALFATSPATAAANAKRIASSLLAPPNSCTPPCIWGFQPGKQTLAAFKQLALAVYGDTAKDYIAPDGVVTGVYSGGVALHTSTASNPKADTVVDYLYVRVDVPAAQTAGIAIDSFAPSVIVQAFGAPTDAYLLFSAKHLRRYTLLLYYQSQSMVFVVRSAFQKGQACLTLDGVETLTLYRFADAASAEKFVKDTSGSDSFPPPISTTTKQTAKDLPQMSRNPGITCLVPR